MPAIISIVILIVSVVAHEVAHGYAAKWEGDETASALGRLSINPIRHIDLFGSIILPTLTYMFGGFVIGWAKPVPVNPSNFRHTRWGEALVSFAGPATNIILAIVFSVLIRFVNLDFSSVMVAQYIVLINIVLAVFNLIPVPPLDGSHILSSVFPKTKSFFYKIQNYGLFLPLVIVLFIWQFFFPVVGFIFKLFTGIAL